MSSKKRFSKLSAYQQRRIARNESSSSSSSSLSSVEDTKFHELTEDQQYQISLQEINQETLEEECMSESITSENVTLEVSQQLSEDSVSPSQQLDAPFDQTLVPPPSFSYPDAEPDCDDESDPYFFSDDDLLEYEDDNESHDEANEAVDQLRDFCLANLKDDTTNTLLKILRDGFHLESVPKNVKNLYTTPNTTMPNAIEIEGGHYLHLGIKNNLHFVPNIDSNLIHLTLNFSWDGVRLFKSSNTNIWPLVMDVEEIPELDVMLVGIFIGNSKPKNSNEFFFCFNKEIMEIADNNFEVEVGVQKQKCTIHTNYMIADTPARIWALGKCNLLFKCIKKLLHLQ